MRQRIRITAPPESLKFALPYMNEYSVGVEVPLASRAMLDRYPPSDEGMIPKEGEGYIVLRTDFVQALVAANRGDAALFWQRNHWGMYLNLTKDDCAVVD